MILLLIPAIIFFLIFFSVICVITQFFYVAMNKGNGIGERLFKATEIVTIVILPVIFLFIFDFNEANDCCNDSAFFSPGNRAGVYLVILIAGISYFYCSYRKKLGPPILELLVNCFLLSGIVLNILIAIHFKDGILLSIAGNLPIILLFLMVLLKNHELFSNEYKTWSQENSNLIEKICFRILAMNGFIKYPLLLIFCLPLLISFSVVLFLFGQKPDSLIRAFTDTYKHGFSQLDYMCDNVQCGGHYLCSVAANGHRSIVKPQRLGERNGKKIICNRQLMIANAFEELIEEKMPRVHRVIRDRYDKVGDFIHGNYNFFNRKIVSDFVYIIMKPAEWIFLLTLYCVERRPENRINQQYMKRQHRNEIRVEGRNFFDPIL